jgi:hypothetical protein
MYTSTLKETNNKILGTAAGTYFVVTLPDGRKVPTGTVGALFVNIKSYDEGNDTKRAELKPTIKSAIQLYTKWVCLASLPQKNEPQGMHLADAIFVVVAQILQECIALIPK